MRPDSPWYISARAVREYAAILGVDASVDEADFDRCEDELVSIARVAKFGTCRDNGLLEYRGKVPPESRRLLRSRTDEDRLTLLVSTEPRPEGPLPQLVSVALRGSHGRAGKWPQNPPVRGDVSDRVAELLRGSAV